MNRLLTGIWFLLLGVVFAAIPFAMPERYCTDACPGWLTLLLLGYYLLPLPWLLSGVYVGKKPFPVQLKVVALLCILNFIAFAIAWTGMNAHMG